MNYNQVKELIQIIDSSGLTEFDLTLDGASVRMSKLGTKAVSSVDSATAEITPEAIDEPITIIPEEKPIKKEGNIISSPIVGTFYSSPAPDKPDFVSVGDKVKKGDVLCIVEAMKIMNEITSSYDGQVVEILTLNEQMVEYNQPLFRII